MSAAEPAHPAPPGMNGADRGAVIDITKHRRSRGGALHEVQGRWTMATPPGPEPVDQDPGEASLRAWAEDIEISLNEIHQSLTDDDTAATFVFTLRICVRMLEGSHANGEIDQAQLEKLRSSMLCLEQAPRLV